MNNFTRQLPKRQNTGIIRNLFAGLAQLGEQLTCNQKVEGSTPLTGTSLIKPRQFGAVLLFQAA